MVIRMEAFLTHQEIDKVASECRKSIRKFALGSGSASAAPLPGADLAADALMAAAMLEEILKRFQLRQTDIGMLEIEAKAVLLRTVKNHGCRLVGKTITRGLLIRIAAGSAWSAALRRFGKYAPLIGQAISAGIGYAAMSALGNMAINECVKVRKSIALEWASRRIE